MRVLVLLVALSSVILAEEQSTAEKDLAACRRLVSEGEVASALKAYRELFDAHPRHPLLRRSIRDIEEDLKRCHFRRQYRQPSGKDLFGDAARRFSPGTRKIVLEYPRGPEGSLLLKTGRRVWFIDLCFEGDIELLMKTKTVLHEGQTHLPLIVGFCYDMKKNGGYLVYPGDGFEVLTAVVRADEDDSVILGYADAMSGRTELEVRRRGAQIRVRRKGKTVVSVKDSTYKKGYVSFLNLLPQNLTIKGRLERACLQQLLAGHESIAFEKWVEESWDSAAMLPDWAVRGPATSVADDLRLPPGCEVRDREKLAGIIHNCVHGDGSDVEALKSWAVDLEGAARHYVGAIILFAEGSLKSALAELSKLLAIDPSFAPALALRGLIRFDLSRFEEARADFVKAAELAPNFAWPYLGLVFLAVRESDYDAAGSILEKGRKAGAKSPVMERFAEAIQRARRGPLWTRSFELETSHFVVRSDHSRELCREVAHHLETALRSYSLRFPFVELQQSKGRVYVFADRLGYLRYARDRLIDLSDSVGAYDSSLNELLLYKTVDHEGFLHTIRHEGFHRFMHAWLPRCPIWLNEGCAEFFSTASERFAGGFKPGATHYGHLRTLRSYRDYRAPLCELLVMGGPEFREDAAIHYAQSWLLVHLLFLGKDRGLSVAMKGYLTGLGEGLSDREAYEEFFLPVLEYLEKKSWHHGVALDAE